MPIDEPELRSRLAQAAALSSPPRVTTEDVAARVRRIRRRRHWRAGALAAISVAAVAGVASAVAIPLHQGGTRQGTMTVPPPAGPRLSYTVTVNGQARAIPARTGALPLFTVTPGERLTLAVRVTVPRPQALTGLWLGITAGTETAAKVPAYMKPILAGGSRSLQPGTQRFVLHWTVPAGLRPGASRELSADFAWSEGASAGAIAEFAVPLRSKATAPAAVARRLRALALHAVSSCDGARPASIHAVRTTFGKAMTIPDVVDGINLADSAADPVYLVLMKGYFIFHEGGGVPPGVCAHGPSGHYYSALFDGATFVTLEASLGDHPLPVPLRTLGPVLNLGRSVRGRGKR
ncbi:MAG TPA: hypothetical protein VMA72_25475 [Streptosporangiaceae bacterium]|nr:hypothetical protein [Streptosporangiaceae bacterium]